MNLITKGFLIPLTFILSFRGLKDILWIIKQNILNTRKKYLDLKAQIEGGKVVGTGINTHVDLENKSLFGSTKKYINLIYYENEFGKRYELRISDGGDSWTPYDITSKVNSESDNYIININKDTVPKFDKIYYGTYKFSKEGKDISHQYPRGFRDTSKMYEYQIVEHIPLK